MSSKSTTERDGTSNSSSLSDEERATFERIAEEFEDDEVGEICKTVLQSDANEEANS